MKLAILLQHGIDAVELPNGVILANNGDNTYTNMTFMCIKEIYNWLGY